METIYYVENKENGVHMGEITVEPAMKHNGGLMLIYKFHVSSEGEKEGMTYQERYCLKKLIRSLDYFQPELKLMVPDNFQY